MIKIYLAEGCFVLKYQVIVKAYDVECGYMTHAVIRTFDTYEEASEYSNNCYDVLGIETVLEEI